MKPSILVICFAFVAVLGCNSADKSTIYSDLADELVAKGDIYPAPQTEEEQQKLDQAWKRYEDSGFDLEVHQQLQDSTLRIMKTAESKWLLFYGPKMRYATDWEVYGKSWLKDFIDEDFPSTAEKNLIDTLSTTANIRSVDLKISYLNIIFRTTEAKDGPCSLIFSKAFFNQKADKAIVCYEWCDSSELLYVVASKGKWKIQKSARLVEH